jgi:hypothetical protein
MAQGQLPACPDAVLKGEKIAERERIPPEIFVRNDIFHIFAHEIYLENL